MKLAIDAIGVRPGSAAIVTAGVLRGWQQAAPEDEITVFVDGHADFPVPSGVSIQSLVPRDAGWLGRLRAQTLGVRRASASADGLLSALPAGALLGANCPHGVIVYDLRHELRPDQFSRLRRGLRRIIWGWSFRRARVLLCISERTRMDLVRRYPRLEGRARTALLGADHVDSWRPGPGPPRGYVLAFGHFAHKNLDAVLAAWALMTDSTEDVRLRICGLNARSREAAARRVVELGIESTVELLPWLSDGEFSSVFAGARTIVFPSDFEGFGLPAVEALRLGVPVVISDDPALAEVTGGHAVVAAGGEPSTLAAAIATALIQPPATTEAGRGHAAQYTWRRCADTIRSALLEA